MNEKFELPLPALLYFIKSSCHEDLHDTLADLRSIANEISKSIGDHPDFPEELPEFLNRFIHDVQIHLALEENSLFPSIAAGKKMREADPIPLLLNDHLQMRTGLQMIRNITHNFETTNRFHTKSIVLYRKLREMERIILNHIQLEDNILFPMVLKTP